MDFVFEMMYNLSGTIITHGNGWSDTIPKDMLEAVTMERLISSIVAGKDGAEERTATNVEAAIYLYTACLQFPFHGDWFHIYMMCAGEYLEQNKKGIDVWKMLDYEKRELSSQRKQQLRRLKDWIYDKSRAATKTKLGSLNTPKELQAGPKKKKEIVKVQMEFEF